MPLISVIISVYNTEKYISRCVDSVLGQNYINIEVILIDDGSTDASCDICDEYAEKDNRVQVIHKKNGGVASARNTGLDAANGEFVIVMDSDDYVEPDMYERMMEKAVAYDCDVVMCDCLKVFPDHPVLFSHNIREGYYSYEQLKEDYYPYLLVMENVDYPPTISNCLCLWKRSLGEAYATDNSAKAMEPLRYLEGVRFSEDLLFGAQLMRRAKSFYYMKKYAPYHYRIYPGSASHSYPPDKWKDYQKLYAETKRCFSADPEFDFRPQLDRMLLLLIYNALGDRLKSNQLVLREQWKQILVIIESREYRELFQRLSIRDLKIPLKEKVYTFFLSNKLGIYTLMLKARL